MTISKKQKARMDFVADMEVKLRTILLTYTKKDLSEELGMSRPTLDKKLKDYKWKKLEVNQINKIYDRIIGRE